MRKKLIEILLKKIIAYKNKKKKKGEIKQRIEKNSENAEKNKMNEFFLFIYLLGILFEMKN